MLYNIIISPLEYLIEVLFAFFYQIIEFDIISSIFFISFFVSVLCLPFYCRADKIRKEEEDKYLEIKPYVNKIKTNFKGDEQFFLLQTLYRQNNYNPIMALRNSFSLLLQIPFFIAAYHFFSNLELLNNYSWGIFADFSKPDKLLSINGFNINILPIIMTVINIISCELYLKEKTFKQRFQPYLFAFAFLIILYNSPSALVIYWTFNNFFYLLKNKYMDNNPKNFIFILLSLGCIVSFMGDSSSFLDISNIPFVLLKKVFPFLIIFLIIIYWEKIKKNLPVFKDCSNHLQLTLALCAIELILLHGIIIPTGLLTSDLQSFSTDYNFLKNINDILIDNLFAFIGLFFIWFFIIFYYIKKDYRIYFVVIILSFSLFSLFNYYNIGKELGTISPDLVFDVGDSVQRAFGSIFVQIPNILILLFIITCVAYLFKKNLIKPILFVILTILLSESIVSAIYLYKLITGINNIYITKESRNSTNAISNEIELSRTGKNVIIIFLDRFPGCLLPMIFNEKPELKKSYSGFVFYPNTVSFYGATILGYPPCIGGYEYTPFVLDKDKRNFSEKWLESNLMLLTLFKDKKYVSTVVDPELYFYSSYKENNLGSTFTSRGIKYVKMRGRYYNRFQTDKLNDQKPIKRIKKKLYMYSYFCTVSNIFKNLLYNNGYYLLARTKGNKDRYFDEIKLIEDYSALLYMKDITKTNSSGNNTFTIINNQLPHNKYFLQYPTYEYAKNVTDIGPNNFINESSLMSYHTTMASAILVAKYLDYLKEVEVYDNSRIIIVSDHGNRFLTMPKYTDFQNKSVVPFNPLLMVKDFNQNFELKTDSSFMTNADTPSLAAKDLIDNPTNPFTGKKLSTNDKSEGANIYLNSYYWNPSEFTSSKAILDKHPIIKHVKDDIFKESNWEKATY